jgi:hypothetical protein
MTIAELFMQAIDTPSDIREHLETLRRLAAECRHVTEFGTRAGVSTTALLMAQPDELHAYDIVWDEQIATLTKAAERTRFHFHQENTLQAVIEPTEMLFIDTVHTGTQVYAELTRHAHKVSRYLAFHDTVSCGERDPYVPSEPGLLWGIDKYMTDHPEWRLKVHYPNNNGLTVYEHV